MLIIFDMEGVLVDEEFLPVLARKIGKEKEVLDITLKGIRGEIDWEDGLMKRIDVLKGMNYEDVLEAANEMPLMKNAKETCDGLKKLGFVLVGVTGGFSIFSDRVKKELNLDYVFSNELVFENGKLTGVRLSVNSDKSLALTNLIRKLGSKKEEIVVVIDGANDLKLFDIGGLKIAFNAQDIVKRQADVVIDGKDLMKLVPVIGEFNGRI